MPYSPLRSEYFMKPDYHEGPEALERFERGMSKLFKASKDSVNQREELRWALEGQKGG